MSFNDSAMAPFKAVDIPDGLANPTSASVYGNPQKDHLVPTAESATAENASQDAMLDATKIEPLGTDPAQAASTTPSSTGEAAGQATSILTDIKAAAQTAIESVTGASK